MHFMTVKTPIFGLYSIQALCNWVAGQSLINQSLTVRAEIGLGDDQNFSSCPQQPLEALQRPLSQSDVRLIFLFILITKADCAAYAQGYEGCTD